MVVAGSGRQRAELVGGHPRAQRALPARRAHDARERRAQPHSGLHVPQLL